MRISDWSSDVCSSDLKGLGPHCHGSPAIPAKPALLFTPLLSSLCEAIWTASLDGCFIGRPSLEGRHPGSTVREVRYVGEIHGELADKTHLRSEEHTSEHQQLMRISYAVFCLKEKNNK